MEDYERERLPVAKNLLDHVLDRDAYEVTDRSLYFTPLDLPNQGNVPDARAQPQISENASVQEVEFESFTDLEHLLDSVMSPQKTEVPLENVTIKTEKPKRIFKNPKRNLILNNLSCSICGHVSKAKGYLIKHINEVHYKVKPYSCPYCAHRSSRRENMNSHIDKVHSMPIPWVPVEKFNKPDVPVSAVVLADLEVQEKSKLIEQDLTRDMESVEEDVPQSMEEVTSPSVQSDEKVLPSKMRSYKKKKKVSPATEEFIEDNLTPSVELEYASCAICNAKFNDKQSYYDHMNAEHKITTGLQNPKTICRLQCCFCDYSCYRKDLLKRHIRLKHKEVRRTKEEVVPDQEIKKEIGLFPCEICSREFTYAIHLSRHVKEVHEKSKPFTCTLCDYKCTREDHLVRHVACVHKKVKEFSCKDCEFTCNRKYNLELHMKKDHNKAFDLFCKFCPFKCNDSELLEKHQIRAHRNKLKLYSCPHCNYTVAKKTCLQRHLKRTHRPRALKNLQCDQCDYTTLKNGCLIKHKRNIHSEEPKEIPDTEEVTTNQEEKTEVTEKQDSKLFQCIFCDFNTNKKRKLTMHLHVVH